MSEVSISFEWPVTRDLNIIGTLKILPTGKLAESGAVRVSRAAR